MRVCVGFLCRVPIRFLLPPYCNALLSVEGYALMQGGMPIVVNGEVIGAIGVSGVQSTQDEQIAKAGTDTIK